MKQKKLRKKEKLRKNHPLEQVKATSSGEEFHKTNGTIAGKEFLDGTKAMGKIKINWIIAFIWLVLIPTVSALSWYGIIKFIQWSL